MKKIHLSEVDSTNSYLKQNYKTLTNYTFVSTDKQTAGRGRNNRTWKSEDSKNLLFSLLILDKELIKEYKKISIISAYTIIEVLKEYNINDLSIKWPNDIYYKDDKLCGILLEAVTTNDIECLIIGVGLNVNQELFDGDYIHKPISLKNILDKEISINNLKDKIYQKFISNLNNLLKGYDYYQEIINYDYLKNKEVYAVVNDIKKKVIVKGINKDFSLMIIDEEKEIKIDSGEISFHV